MDYFWTKHSEAKIKFYSLSKQRVRRVLNSPKRIETGIAPDTIAMMQVAGSQKHPYEIWVMTSHARTRADRTQKNAEKFPCISALSQRKSATTRVVSAWKYPGRTKPGEPLPPEILREIRESL